MDKNLKRCVCVYSQFAVQPETFYVIYTSVKNFWKYTTLWQNLDFGGGFVCGDRRYKNTVCTFSSFLLWT